MKSAPLRCSSQTSATGSAASRSSTCKNSHERGLERLFRCSATGQRLRVIRHAECCASVLAQADATELSLHQSEHEEGSQILFGDAAMPARDFGERCPFVRGAGNTT